MSSVRGRIARGSFWLTLGRAVSNILGLVSILVLARLLLPEDFGLVGIGIAVLAVTSAVTALPLGAALVRHADPQRSHLHTIWTMSVMRGALIAALIAIGGIPAAEIYGDPRLATIMAVLALSPLADGLRNPRSILLTRDLVFWQQVVLQLADKLTLVIVSVAVAFAFQSYWALVAGAVAGKVIAAAASYLVMPYRPRFGLQHWRELASFSYWVTLSQMVNELNWRFDQLLIGGYVGQAALGFYRVGSDVAMMPTREITSPLTTTLFPAFAALGSDRPRLAAAYARAQAMTVAIALPAGIGTALIAEPLVRLTMTDKWLPAVFVVEALAAVFALQTLGSLAQPLGMSAGATRLLFRRDAQFLAVRIPIVVIGMLVAGLPGVVYGRVLSGLLGVPLNLSIVRNLTGLGIRRQLRQVWRSIVSVAVMAVLTHLLDQRLVNANGNGELAARIAFCIAAAMVSYAGAHLLLWRLSGRPVGVEQELLRVARTAIDGVRQRRGSTAIGVETDT